MEARVINFGRTHKNEYLTDCPISYLRWLVAHEKRLLESNRWASRDAKVILDKMAQVAAPVVVEEIIEPIQVVEIAAPVVVEAPKQTYRIITVPGPKRGRYDLLAEIEAKRESKFALLGEINEIKARKRSEDIGLRGSFGSKPFSILKV